VVDTSALAVGASDPNGLFGRRSLQVQQSPTSATTLNFYWTRTLLYTGITTLRYCVWPGTCVTLGSFVL
jgi:hypothetical protein